MNYIFLSHDVDWRKQGPSPEHIMARKERFESNILKNLDSQNPYYNFPDYMELEDKLGIRSTFFFRTKYENGDYLDYEDEINELSKGGWEIGLHSDPNLINNIENVRKEKNDLEILTKNEILGNRVHYLGFNQELPQVLQELGFIYDSSIKHTKDSIDVNDTGYYFYDKLIELPITLMDAYMFTYMKLSENQIISTAKQALDMVRNDPKKNIISVIWHDNVLKMKGGRMYYDLIEFFTNQNDFEICTGKEIAAKINN
tara:strand:+ start:186 stop:956 length:771 start_codon:yes stop_codon:yes gene_type:complete